MDGIFIDLYKKIAEYIDDNETDTHNIKEEDKEKWKLEFRKMLNSDPEKLEPLYSRMAKCKAMVTRQFYVHVFDESTDGIFTNIWEFLNGMGHAGFGDVSALIEFEDGFDGLEESVYIRFSDDFKYFYIYDMKPNIIKYDDNSDTVQGTSNFDNFKRKYPKYSEYINKWEKSDKNLQEELPKWEDMLWLGRSLALFPHYDKETQEKVKPIQDKVITKWGDDPDFIKCMYRHGYVVKDEEFGDSQWAEICYNVGALRYLLGGVWDLTS